MTIRKTILIWAVSFTVVLTMLNLGLFLSYFNNPSDTGMLTQDQSQTISRTQPYLFPLSADVVQAAGNQVLIQTPTKTHTITSKFYLELTTLGVSAPIILEPSTDINKVYNALEGGVVHYASTPLPGEWGTSMILGHSSKPWNYKGNYAYTFSKLEKMNEGDTFRIYKDGQPMVFKVSRKIIFSPNTSDQEALREFEKASGYSVILMTCWPTGTNSKRIALRAELVS